MSLLEWVLFWVIISTILSRKGTFWSLALFDATPYPTSHFQGALVTVSLFSWWEDRLSDHKMFSVFVICLESQGTCLRFRAGKWKVKVFAACQWGDIFSDAKGRDTFHCYACSRPMWTLEQSPRLAAMANTTTAVYQSNILRERPRWFPAEFILCLCSLDVFIWLIWSVRWISICCMW